MYEVTPAYDTSGEHLRRWADCSGTGMADDAGGHAAPRAKVGIWTVLTIRLALEGLMAGDVCV